MPDIRSVTNEYVKGLCALSTAKGRSERGCYLIEGKKMLVEALEAGSSIEYVLLDENRCADFVPILRERGIKAFTAPERILEKVSDTRSPQGVAACLKIPEEQSERFPMLVLDGVQDPGNCGAIWRTCEAAGYKSVAFLPGCADPFSPKVVRATMGAVLRVPALERERSWLNSLKENGVTLVAAALSGDLLGKSMIIREPYALIVGSEARGVSAEAMALAQKKVRLPMKGRVESLNAAIAAAILMYALEGGND